MAAGQSGTERTLPALEIPALGQGELSFSWGDPRLSQGMQDRSPCTSLSSTERGSGQAGLERDRTWMRKRKKETQGREGMILWGKLCKYVLPFADKGGCEALRGATLFVCSHTLAAALPYLQHIGTFSCAAIPQPTTLGLGCSSCSSLSLCSNTRIFNFLK